MNYAQLRNYAFTGDILFQAGDSLGAKFLRVFTASQFSHVALLVWVNGGLWVAEIVPKTGYTLSPASQRIPEMLAAGNLWYAKAPAARGDLSRPAYREAIMKYRDNSPNKALDPALDPSYSMTSALLTWVAQLTNRNIPVKLICSTFVQEVWEADGVEFERPADPESLVDYVDTLIRVKGGEVYETGIESTT